MGTPRTTPEEWERRIAAVGAAWVDSPPTSRTDKRKALCFECGEVWLASPPTITMGRRGCPNCKKKGGPRPVSFAEYQRRSATRHLHILGPERLLGTRDEVQIECLAPGCGYTGPMLVGNLGRTGCRECTRRANRGKKGPLPSSEQPCAASCGGTVQTAFRRPLLCDECLAAEFRERGADVVRVEWRERDDGGRRDRLVVVRCADGCGEHQVFATNLRRALGERGAYYCRRCPSRWREKPCASCGQTFVPAGGQSALCDDCFMEQFRTLGLDVVGLGQAAGKGARAPVLRCKCGAENAVQPGVAREAAAHGRGYLCIPCATAEIAKDPEWQEKVRAAARIRSEDPAWRAATAEAGRRWRENPEAVARHAAGVAARNADPDFHRRLQEAHDITGPQRIYLVGGRGIVKAGRTSAARGAKRLRENAAAGLDTVLALWLIEEEYALTALAEMEIIAGLRDTFPGVSAYDLPNGWSEAVYADGDEIVDCMAIARVVIEEALRVATLEAWEPLAPWPA